MNFLAHIYLSGDNDQITLGNFIADSIRGKKYKKFPVDVQKGVLLHRAIDTFTDAHPVFRQSTKRLHKRYSHYSGVIVDILYDHFLAKNWTTYCDEPLEEYVDNFYTILEDNFDILPPTIQKMMVPMIANNWLVSYASFEGIASVLAGMNRRTKMRSGMDKATEELKTYYNEFENEFTNFFEELIQHSQEQLKILSST